jgi:hypothetical protein
MRLHRNENGPLLDAVLIWVVHRLEIYLNSSVIYIYMYCYETLAFELSIGTGVELLWFRYWTFGFHKMLGNYRMASQLVAFEVVLSSIELLHISRQLAHKNENKHNLCIRNLQVNLFIFPARRQVMKTCGEVEVCLHAFLIFLLSESEWSA